MDYMCFRFDVVPAQPGSEILIAHLGEMGFESFEQDEHGFNAYIPSPQAQDLKLEELQFPGILFQWTANTIPDRNWNAVWEESFEPVVVDDLLCIRATFHEISHSCRYEIIITPKMSFGTGHHQTTRLVCRALADLAVKGSSVLDMGCGTGVLAILAAKMEAAHVTAIDIDEWSVENARENCAKNNCPEISIRKGDESSIKANEHFDIILANINRNILRKQFPAYALHANPGASLVISGFFTTDCDELEAVAAGAGFKKSGFLNDGEWAAMIFKR